MPLLIISSQATLPGTPSTTPLWVIFGHGGPAIRGINLIPFGRASRHLFHPVDKLPADPTALRPRTRSTRSPVQVICRLRLRLAGTLSLCHKLVSLLGFSSIKRRHRRTSPCLRGTKPLRRDIRWLLRPFKLRRRLISRPLLR